MNTRRTLDQLEDLRRDAYEKDAQLQQLREELEACHKRCAEVSKGNPQREQDLLQKVSDLTEKSKQVDALADQLAEEQQQKERAERLLEEAQDNFAALDEDQKKILDQLEELRNDIYEKDAELQRLRGELDACYNRCREVSSNPEAEQNLTEAVSDVAEKSKQVDILTIRLARERQRKERERLLEEAHDGYAALDGDFKKTLDQLETLRREVYEKDAELQNLRDQLEACHKRFADLNNDSASGGAQEQELELIEKAAELSKRNRQIEALEEKIAELEAELLDDPDWQQQQSSESSNRDETDDDAAAATGESAPTGEQLAGHKVDETSLRPPPYMPRLR